MAHRKSLNRTAKQRRIAHFLSQPLQAAAPGQSATLTAAQKADLEARTVGRVVFPWDPDYEQDRQETNPAFQYYPLAIIYCALFFAWALRMRRDLTSWNSFSASSRRR